ncbi:hypothetical protein R3P93_22565 [Rhodococcus cerastii]|uniref:Antitoxin Xre/MbcA/ParS-like toxin-binding domain-containing protein n=1 Tax=Rhodococcus cerastii TaxID=908616 RepID=A0ABU4D7U9_9NOCA|nr:hypothetical protein [Rhodococcus cerastii]MDV6305357.1 hypothetical protein [Rhodococcus cerastii]
MSTRDGEPDSNRAISNDEHQPHGAAPRGAASELLLTRSMQYIRDALNLLSHDDVAEILGHGAARLALTVDELRTAGRLIGFPSPAGAYEYPSFQIDTELHRVHPIAAQANRALRADRDPYGVASWWLTTTDLLDGRSPLDELTDGTLTAIAVDNILNLLRSGM